MLLKPNRIIIGVTLLLLLIPLIAMQFTNEVNWTTADFLAAGILLLSTGFLLLFMTKKVKNTQYRITFTIVILLTLLLIWVELAVGIF